MDLNLTSARTWRAGVGALVVLVLGAALLTVSGSATAVNGNRTGPLDNRGFPRYYRDDAGTGLKLCEDGSAFCLRARRRALRPPDGEALYWAALAHLRTRRGPLDVEFALEAAFEGRRPTIISRLRVRGHLNHRGRYVLHHPYGSLRFRAIAPREQRNVNVTIDRRCSRVRGGLCALRVDRWLRSTRRHAGYLGTRRRTRVTGGSVRNSLALEGRRLGIIGRTAKFRVVGKLCGQKCRARARRVSR
jgi:hypothetical protein